MGPGEAAEGWNTIRAPTNHVWALARILVDGPHDLDAARRVQAELSMQGPACDMPGPYAARSAPWAEYLSGATALMAANPPPLTDLKMLREMAPLGLLEGFDPAQFSTSQIADIEAGLADGRAAVRTGGLGGGEYVEGWSYPGPRLGDFDQDYAFRGAIAISGLAALPPAEAAYMRAEGPEPGDLFDGTKAWRLHFAADGHLPVNSFWSLSLYEATEDGQFFFADNPLSRYAIGDRTPGLQHNADRSLDIWIGHEDPGGEQSANWLPAPAGPFALTIRAYLPKPELLEGRYRLPAVRAA